MWLHLSSPPPSAGGKTQVPPPPAALRSQLAALAQNQKWAALLEETESAAPLHRFALDLHRLSWQALAGLGSSQDRARAALVAEMRALLARMPQLPGLAFADGTPFAEPQTRTWISSEIELSPEGTGPRPQRGNGGEGAEARLAQARKLLDATQATQALALLQEAVTAARAGRDRFLARLDLARVAAGAGFPAVAKAVYEELDREASAHDLDAWEPELVSAYLKGLIAAARALSNDPRGAAFDLKVPYNRLCRLDPAAAHEVWP
jgi:type VI secretion system protein VasJ